VVLAAVVVGLVWKVGQVGASAGPGSASPAAATATASRSPVPSYAAGSTAGAVVPGFPRSLVPVLPGATVVSSSVEPVGDGSHQQVSLGLRTAESAAHVVSAYSDTWKRAGFARTGEKPVAGADAGATFRRALPTPRATGPVGTVQLADYLTVAVVEADGARLVTITGQVPASHG
jgi:hypothetical protein